MALRVQHYSAWVVLRTIRGLGGADSIHLVTYSDPHNVN
jgi:hypothetical protein